MNTVVNVLGVEQAVNFETMQTQAMVVIELWGETLRVPISEAQMEKLTIAAIEARNNGEHVANKEAFAATETHEGFAPGETAIGREEEEEPRDFSMMSGMTDAELTEDPLAQGMDSDGLGIFAPPSAQTEQIEQLRARPSPTVPQRAQSLPNIGGTRDDDFPQG